MNVLLDHIGAVIVGSMLLLAIVVVQQRGRQQTAELTVGNIVKARAYQSLQVLERDIENMRNEAQTLDAGLPWDCRFALSPDSLTLLFTFPSLADPDLGPASPVTQVTYRLVTDSTLVPYAGQMLLLHRLEREVDDGTGARASGGSGTMLTRFHVEGGLSTGGTVESGSCPSGLHRVHVEMEAVMETVEQVTSDQQARGNVNVARLGSTVYTLN